MPRGPAREQGRPWPPWAAEPVKGAAPQAQQPWARQAPPAQGACACREAALTGLQERLQGRLQGRQTLLRTARLQRQALGVAPSAPASPLHLPRPAPGPLSPHRKESEVRVAFNSSAAAVFAAERSVSSLQIPGKRRPELRAGSTVSAADTSHSCEAAWEAPRGSPVMARSLGRAGAGVTVSVRGIVESWRLTQRLGDSSGSGARPGGCSGAWGSGEDCP